MGEYIIALDQGTTSSRALIFDRNGKILSKAQISFRQIYPEPGWVEHDPEEILASQLKALCDAFVSSGLKAADIAGIGITNQRETTILWDRHTGKPVYNAIVWQCRRTAEDCEALSSQGLGDYISEKTGLLIDAYFSATKIRWILNHVPEARAKAERGDLLFGTMDSWLIWNLTGGNAHVTDYSNASRTMLFDIGKLAWDSTLCRALDIPEQILPQPVPNSQLYGRIASGLPGGRSFSSFSSGLEELTALEGVPICGSAGDQPAALFGQGCLRPGDMKNTYGTGCFTLMNTGNTPVRSGQGLLSSVAWSTGTDSHPVYALEGSVFNGGSTIQWIRDELGLISSSHECDILAEEVSDSGGVFVVPAFTGLGAPYWGMYARGAVLGLTRGSNKKHIARAVLESIAYQVADLVTAMSADAGGSDQGSGRGSLGRSDSSRLLTELRADGGASVSDLMLQFQADLLGIPVSRPSCVETTALGAAGFAGLATGIWKSPEEFASLRQTDAVFHPQTGADERIKRMEEWHRAVKRASGWVRNE